MRGREVFECPVGARIHAFLPIPPSWGKRKKELALSGDVLPTTKPDVDNLIKSVIDGLNKIVFLDDSYIVDLSSSKRYSRTPRVIAEIYEVPGTASQEMSPKKRNRVVSKHQAVSVQK